jgi:hypothetical protein
MVDRLLRKVNIFVSAIKKIQILILRIGSVGEFLKSSGVSKPGVIRCIPITC